jgi:hypothetical protein
MGWAGHSCWRLPHGKTRRKTRRFYERSDKKTIEITGNHELWGEMKDICREWESTLTSLKESTDVTQIDQAFREKVSRYESTVSRAHDLFREYFRLKNAESKHEADKIVRMNRELSEAYKEILTKCNSSLHADTNRQDASPKSRQKRLYERLVSEYRRLTEYLVEKIEALTFELVVRSIRYEDIHSTQRFIKNMSKGFKRYKRRNYVRSLIQKLIYLFWSLMVFTIGVDAAFDTFEKKIWKLLALSLFWEVQEFYLVPLLHRKLNKRQREDLERAINGFYIGKIDIECQMEVLNFELIRSREFSEVGSA